MAEDHSPLYVLKILCSGKLAGNLADVLMEYCGCTYVYVEPASREASNSSEEPSNPDKDSLLTDTLYTDEHFDRTGEHDALWNDSCVVADLPLDFEERSVQDVVEGIVAQASSILQPDSDLRWWVEEQLPDAPPATSQMQITNSPIQHGRFVFLPYQPDQPAVLLEVHSQDETNPQRLVPIVLDFEWAGVDGAMVFGDGAHPSTSLCVEWLEKNIKENDKVLDMGCGSGILAVVAFKLGAIEVLGIDNSEAALETAKRSAMLNSIPEAAMLLSAPIDPLNPQEAGYLERYDLVVCNMPPGLLAEVAPQFSALASRTSRVVVAGFLSKEVDRVTQLLLSHGYHVETTTFKAGWACLGASRRHASQA